MSAGNAESGLMLRPHGQAHARAVLSAGAAALERLAEETAGVVCDNLPALGDGTESVSVLFLWPGWLLELGPCGEIVAETPAAQMLTLRPRAATHLVLHTRGCSLLRVPIDLPGGGLGEAVFKATGRVLIRGEGGRVLARSLPGRPAEIDPLFSSPPAAIGAA